MSPLLLVYAEIIAVVLMWSHAPVAIKYCLQFVDPWTLVVIRHIPVAIVFAFILGFRSDAATLKTVTRTDWWRLLIVGFFAVTGYHFSLNSGAQYVTAGTMALIVGMVPLFTLLIAAIALRERVTLTRATGIVVAFFGLYICVRYGGAKAIELTHVVGVLITLLAPVFGSCYTVFSRPLARRHGAINATGMTFLFGTLPLLITVNPGMAAQIPTLPLGFWGALMFLSLGCTALAYVLWAHALRRLEATNVAVFIYMIPLLGLVWGWLYLGETLSIWIVLGAVLIVGGVAMANRRAPVVDPVVETSGAAKAV